MQRGFKSFAEELSLQVRREMGIPAHGRLCAFKLTEYLGIPTIGFSSLMSGARECGVTPRELQAMIREVHGLCIPYGAGRAILYNDQNQPARQQSDVAHETSHVLLGHPMSDLASVGQRRNEVEAEAAHLGGALLIPLPAALHILQRRFALDDAAAQYGVSPDMVIYRCNASGARVIHQRRTGGRSGHQRITTFQ
jgi:hypothetical protein